MILRFLLLCLISLTALQAQQPSKVLISIKPLYGLVAKITKGTGIALDLIYTGQNSPHTAGLSIDNVSKIKAADLIFWAGAVYETVMAKHMNNQSNAIDLSKTKDLLLLPPRIFDGNVSSCHHGCDHHHDHEEHSSAHHSMDGHYWLDINNAIIIVKNITRILIDKTPEHATLMQKNCDEAIANLTAFGRDLKTKIKPITYLSFHDFTQYFDHYFGTSCAGVIVMDPHHGAQIKHLEDLMKTHIDKKIAFVIKEKQFKADILSIFKKKGLTIKTLDYLGTDLNPDDFVYERIITELMEGFLKEKG